MRHVMLVAAAVGMWSVATAASLAQTNATAQTPAAQTTPSKPESDPKKADAPKKPNFDIDLNEPDEDAPKPALQAAPKKPGVPNFEDEDDQPPVRPASAHGAFTGSVECARCHEKQAIAYIKGPHGRRWDSRTPEGDIGCERCHGAGLAHDLEPKAKGKILGFKTSAPREVTRLCLSCHDNREHTDWQGGMHAVRNVSCVSCHSVHAPKSERVYLKQATVTATCAQCHRDKAAKMQRSGHMPVREGKMDCTSCHNAHGSTNVRMLKTGSTVNESCVSCHAEKRGPFLWDHMPVSDNCTTCHDSHGSSNDRMLAVRAPMLCQRCHVSTRHPATPYDGLTLASGSNRLIGRSCVTCHPTLHGSNHPSGQFFMR